jgi:xanthine dehydrogenase FAD-binding subunit
LPVLAKALKVLGSPLIRNMGTIAGNICTASPAGDALPPLYVLDAQVELRTQHGSRRLSIRDFIISPGKTCLQEKEIVASIRIRKPLEYNVHHYEKVGQRNALACSIAGLAALLQVSPDGIVVRASLAWGSVGPTILTCPEAEEALVGKRLSLENLRKAAAVVREAARPISDVRAEADYRRMVSGNLLLRLMEAARPFLTHGSDRD